jgi:predicted lipoprotein with Yx(FWY)xxD motif
MTGTSRSPTRARRGLALGLISAVAVFSSGCQMATNELNPGREELKVADKAPLGKVVVSDEGRTLYLFENDEPDESYCSGACASVWPPVTTEGTPAVEGLDASKVTLIKRDDGLMQVVYNGHPLYYYQGDTDAEDSYGQEKDQFGAEWYAVTASGAQAGTEGSDDGYGS